MKIEGIKIALCNELRPCQYERARWQAFEGRSEAATHSRESFEKGVRAGSIGRLPKAPTWPELGVALHEARGVGHLSPVTCHTGFQRLPRHRRSSVDRARIVICCG